MGFASELCYEIQKLSELCLTDEEASYLKGLGLFPSYYIDFLKGYRFDSSEVSVTEDWEGQLEITIEGYWFRTILWEVPLMALISQLYFRETDQEVDISLYKKWDSEKGELLVSHNANFADFGTRRRYSFDNQERIVQLFKKYPTFVGTSNVYLAMAEGVKPMGTMAHEWIMVYGALYGYKLANKLALEAWSDVYDGDLGIALSDTYTTSTFFKSFSTKPAKLFDGVRHDSGDPFEFTDTVIQHYKSLGIDPMSKVIIFSDGLTPELACEIKEYCVGKIKSSFGIGTNFTNDVGVTALNIVIKVSDVLIDDEWYPCVKLSDNPGKHTGDSREIALCKGILRLDGDK
jgi:nicotinate phosphoribosyltransferase